MGAYSPAPVVTAELHRRIMRDSWNLQWPDSPPTASTYVGFLYAGLMIGEDGAPRVLEYNCRLGDPETQPILMRLESDLLLHCLSALDGTLTATDASWSQSSALGVVMAAGGYPGDYARGDRIRGLDAATDARTKIFHAGTTATDDAIVTSGGRVLCVTALGDDVREARQRAYQTVEQVSFKNAFYRRDIGHRAVDRQAR